MEWDSVAAVNVRPWNTRQRAYGSAAASPAASWDGEVTYEAVHTQLLRADVAAVKVRQVYHSAQGDTQGTPLYVMTRQDDGRWLLHAGQNTEVHAG